MQDDLKNKGSEAYKQKLELAMSAFDSGCLIYSHDTCNWYTAREFMESKERVIYKMLGMEKHSNFTLIYPKQAIERKMEDLQKAQLEFDMFIKKVLGAFQISPLDSKNKKQ
jgi:sulfate adenylyltransferase subunit 1 (EFTu-like GTPase family)